MNVYVYMNNGTINEAAANALLYPTQRRMNQYETYMEQICKPQTTLTTY